MNNSSEVTRHGGGSIPWRILGWGGALALLCAPLIAMQFTREVNWDETDFIVAGIIFAIVGGLIEVAVHVSSNGFYRAGAVFAVLGGFMVVWANLAVGMIGNEDNPVNLWFGLVLAIAIGGAILSRAVKPIMATTMLTAGTVQAAIGLFAGLIGSDPRGGVFTLILSGLWFVAAALFRAAKA